MAKINKHKPIKRRRYPVNYGLSSAYAAECVKELKGLEPSGVCLGLLELCKLAMKKIGELEAAVGP